MSGTDALRNLIAGAGLLFTGSHLIDQSSNFARLDASYRDDLDALDHLPFGARVFAVTYKPCGQEWSAGRKEHLAAMATVRRDALVNGVWPMPGGRLLSVRYRPAGDWVYDPSEFALPSTCPMSGGRSFERAMAELPRNAFDFVWLFDFSKELVPHDPHLVPVWRSSQSALYRIVP